MSLRRRVLLGFLLVAVALVITNVVLASAFEDDLLDRADEDLVTTANRPAFAPGGRVRPRAGPRQVEPLSDLYFAVAGDDGSRLTRIGNPLDEDQSPPDPSPEQLRAEVGRPFTVDSADGDTRWRVVAVPGRLPDGLLVVATDLEQMDATLRRMWLIQVVGSAAVLVALAAVLWWVLRLGVRPLVAMATTADEIVAGDLTHRVDQEDDGTEAGRLATAFNAMLGRIEQAFREREASEERLRRFAADASHELRTPLTSIRGYAELWEAGGLRGEGELDQAMRRLSQEGRRMGTLVEDLLLLARLDEHRAMERQPVRLDQLAADAVADASAVDPDRTISLHVAPVTVDGDEQQLRQVVANLLTNARVHTPAGTPVHVSVAADGGTARLVVADEGPGMANEVAERVFERFYRGDPARGRVSGGSGLGLSIVDAVVRAHGGRVTADGAEGSRFEVELPRVPSRDATPA